MSGDLQRTLFDRSRNILLRKLLLPVGDMFNGNMLMRRVRFLEEAQWWDAERVVKERDARLREVAKVAYEEVPFYRDLFDRSGVRPEDIRRREDISRLPSVTKQMLLARYPRDVSRPTGRRVYESSTSGSTGKNFRVLEDDRTAGWYRAAFLLAAGWSGWQAGDRHVQMGMNLARSADRALKDALLRCHYVSAFDLTDSALDATLAVMERQRTAFLWGYPGSLHYLARRAETRGWNVPLAGAVTWGDSLYPEFRSTIERTFRTRVFDTYGCAEGIQVSAQCGHGPWYHVHALDTIVDYADDDGNSVAEGTPGHLLLTRLYPGPMPLLRYRVGDMGTAGKRTTCPCGRSWEIMQEIRGRATDVVVTPKGNRLIVHFFTGILEYFREIDMFQVVQESPSRIVVKVVPTGSIDETLRARIVERLRDKGADDLDIEVEYVDDVPLTPGGKRRFVISKYGAVSGNPTN